MSNPLHPMALFRIAALGNLLTRDKLAHGERKQCFEAIAARSHRLPASGIKRFSAKTIERWYYKWQDGGVDALVPKTREDKGKSLIRADIQDAILSMKQEQPARSVNTIKALLEEHHFVGKDKVSRSAIYRFLKGKGVSSRSVTGRDRIERRSFVAEYASDIWHADVLHGPTLLLDGKRRKTYLVSMLDDASRAIMHSEFHLSEQAVDIEYVFKQAVLKRGLPKKLILDNGAAYRSHTLKSIAARLEVQLVFCPAYEPQGKGKLERWHRSFREQCLAEMVLSAISSLDEMNRLLWAWIDRIYHHRPHSGLDNEQTPLERWQADLEHVRSLGELAKNIDAIFYHYAKRKVKKDGCISYNGQSYEVPYELSEQQVTVVFDPEQDDVVGVQTDGTMHPVHLLDKLANSARKRQRPKAAQVENASPEYSLTREALKNHQNNLSIIDNKEEGV